MFAPMPRPLNSVYAGYPSYAADQKLLHNILLWTRSVRLGGKNHDLGIAPDDVFQVPSNYLNHATYAIVVRDIAQVQKILSEGAKEERLEKKIGAKLEELNITGAILLLQRGIRRLTDDERGRKLPKELREVYERLGREEKRAFFKAGTPKQRRMLVARLTKTMAKGDAKRVAQWRRQLLQWLSQHGGKKDQWVVSDRYRLLVHVNHLPIPLLVVWPSEITPWYSHLTASNALSIIQQLPNYEALPEPDDIYLTWHELARLRALDWTRLYLRACVDGVHQPVRCQSSTGDYFLHRISESDSQQLEYPPIQYDIAFALDPMTTLPESEYSTTYDDITIHNAYDVRADPHVLIPPTVSLSDHFGGQFGGDDFDLKKEPYQVPQPERPPSGLVGALVIKLLTHGFQGPIEYVGDGFFRLKAADLTTLAAGTGNWGSPEMIAITIMEIGVGGFANASRGTAGLIKVGLWITQEIYEEEIEDELQVCYSLSPGECQACVEGSMAMSLNTGQLIGNALGTAGSIAALAAATGPLAIFGAAVGLLVIGVAIYMDLERRRELDDPCVKP